ncbi:type VI secretion system tube protein TssD [Aquimarina longa]|uniref:type VI secretion system tube protein TssD n=1 Tax=Aquimarina longa TaxID=1080221 RepID=UPI00130E8F1D|nr:type VI secretion system tube protein TssD [Aquimarina longa]
MSFLGKLEIEGILFIIEDCTVAINQNSDYNGRPNSKPIAGQFTVTLVYHKGVNLFAEWAASPTMVKNGKVQFFNNDVIRNEALNEITQQLESGFVIEKTKMLISSM